MYKDYLLVPLSFIKETITENSSRGKVFTVNEAPYKSEEDL